MASAENVEGFAYYAVNSKQQVCWRATPNHFPDISPYTPRRVSPYEKALRLAGVVGSLIPSSLFTMDAIGANAFGSHHFETAGNDLTGATGLAPQVDIKLRLDLQPSDWGSGAIDSPYSGSTGMGEFQQLQAALRLRPKRPGEIITQRHIEQLSSFRPKVEPAIAQIVAIVHDPNTDTREMIQLTNSPDHDLRSPWLLINGDIIFSEELPSLDGNPLYPILYLLQKPYDEPPILLIDTRSLAPQDGETLVLPADEEARNMILRNDGFNFTVGIKELSNGKLVAYSFRRSDNKRVVTLWERTRDRTGEPKLRLVKVIADPEGGDILWPTPLPEQPANESVALATRIKRDGVIVPVLVDVNTSAVRELRVRSGGREVPFTLQFTRQHSLVVVMEPNGRRRIIDVASINTIVNDPNPILLAEVRPDDLILVVINISATPRNACIIRVTGDSLSVVGVLPADQPDQTHLFARRQVNVGTGSVAGQQNNDTVPGTFRETSCPPQEQVAVQPTAPPSPTPGVSPSPSQTPPRPTESPTVVPTVPPTVVPLPTTPTPPASQTEKNNIFLPGFMKDSP